MDAKAGMTGTLWDMIRLLFASDDPADVQRIVGLTRAEVICEGVSQAALTQETYLESFLEGLPEEWAPKRAVKTNGQSTSAPDPKTLEAKPCPTIVRSILGTLMYAARCTRPDLAYPVARLARYTDRWSDPWVDKELKHLLAYVLGSTSRPLCFRSGGDLWEDLWLEMHSDANFAAPCSEGGYCIFLMGDKGTELPLEWRSHRQRLTATSSAESELMEVADAVKATLRLMGLLECCRLTPLTSKGRVDNDAVRLAIGRGASTKLGHMRKHAEVNLEFLRECAVPLERVDTTENTADIFTKIVSTQRLEWHMAKFTGAPRVRNEHGSIISSTHEEHSEKCPRRGLKEVGFPAQVLLACSCISDRKLLQLAVVLASLQMADGVSDVVANFEETVGTWPLQYIGLMLVAGVLLIILMHMVPGGAQTPSASQPDEEQGFVVVDDRAQYIMVEAQAAVAARDAVIAGQAAHIELLTAQVASLSLNASSYAASAAAGPAQGVAARGAAAMATREVGGGYHTSTITMNVTVPTNSVGSAAAAASTGGWTVRDPVTGYDAELMSLPTLPPSVEKCSHPACRARASWNGLVWMTKTGQKYHTASDCHAIRGRDVQRYVMRL